MSKDFVRCYIGFIHFELLHRIQKESGKFNEWELINSSDFDLKNSYFKHKITKIADRKCFEIIKYASLLFAGF